MIRARTLLMGLLMTMGVADTSSAQESGKPRVPKIEFPAPGVHSAHLSLPVALEKIQPASREMLNRVMQAPTLSAVATAEEFPTTNEMYLWLLDHPDRTCLAWQRLKVAAIDITPQADGRFTWKDEGGSELNWRTVAQSNEGRIWYAEGKVRAGAVLPLVPVKAVAVLRHGRKTDFDGDAVICHQVEVFLQTDSKAAALVMRLIGPAAPRLAQEGSEQLLLFFSGIARHIDRHPAKAKTLLAEK